MALQLRVSPTVDGSWYMDVGRTPSIEFAWGAASLERNQFNF